MSLTPTMSARLAATGHFNRTDDWSLGCLCVAVWNSCQNQLIDRWREVFFVFETSSASSHFVASSSTIDLLPSPANIFFTNTRNTPNTNANDSKYPKYRNAQKVHECNEHLDIPRNAQKTGEVKFEE